MDRSGRSRGDGADPGRRAGLTARLRAYVLGSYPPALYLPYAALWALGGTALFGVVDPRVPGRLPDLGVAVTAVTMAVLLLLLRIVDDLRDLDYDREHNPSRPLASGAVSTRDLALLLVAGTLFVLLVNAWRWQVMCLLAGVLGYGYLLLWADRRLRWPAGDALGLGLLVNAPVQILINGYLYAGLLHAEGLAPTWHALVAVAVAMAAFLHLEMGRKTTRRPRPGERSYVVRFGVTGTAVTAVTGAVGSVALLVAARLVTGGPGTAAVWLAVLPLALVAWGARRFWLDRQARWSGGLAALFLLSSFAAYQVISLVEWMVTS